MGCQTCGGSPKPKPKPPPPTKEVLPMPPTAMASAASPDVMSAPDLVLNFVRDRVVDRIAYAFPAYSLDSALWVSARLITADVVKDYIRKWKFPPPPAESSAVLSYLSDNADGFTEMIGELSAMLLKFSTTNAQSRK